MSGAVGLALAFVASIFPETPPWLLWIAAGLCVLLVAFRAWYGEAKGRDAAEAILSDNIAALNGLKAAIGAEIAEKNSLKNQVSVLEKAVAEASKAGRENKLLSLRVDNWIESGVKLIGEIADFPVSPTHLHPRPQPFPPPTHLQTQVHEWTRDADQFVRKHFPKHFAKYTNKEGLPPPQKMDPQKNLAFVRLLEQVFVRVERLKELCVQLTE